MMEDHPGQLINYRSVHQPTLQFHLLAKRTRNTSRDNNRGHAQVLDLFCIRCPRLQALHKETLSAAKLGSQFLCFRTFQYLFKALLRAACKVIQQVWAINQSTLVLFFFAVQNSKHTAPVISWVSGEKVRSYISLI